MQAEDIEKFFNSAISYRDPEDLQNVDAVLTVSTAANAEIFGKVMERGEIMSDVMYELMKDKIQEENRKAVDNKYLDYCDQKSHG